MVWFNTNELANLSDMLAERGISVNRSTIYRWFIEYAPVLRMINKGQFDLWLRNDEHKTLVRERSAFINRLFNIEVVYQ
jgi:transposase-like protein